MFRFWSNDSRGSEKPLVEGDSAVQSLATPAPEVVPRPLKRRRPSLAPTATALQFPAHCSSSKRVKTEHYNGLPSPTSASADGEEEDMMSCETASGCHVDVQRAEEVIQYQFGLEILLKHDELRLINQELAKCQIALEQLRRCHLIPYPVNCPTPQQMLNISAGKGPALQPRPGTNVPKWAPPFGVVEGPYARHYAKWLIPDPVFGILEPEAQSVPNSLRARGVVAEGRTTRNSSTDQGFIGKRSVRGLGSQKLQALSSGYSHPKDRQSPCILKRSDGQTVKLVCVDCHRWDFSSTQGFINHCRIAHRRDYKSHEEAAVHCGQSVDEDVVGAAGDEKLAAAPNSGLAHPLARDGELTEQRAYAALRERLQTALELFEAGKHPYSLSLPVAATSPSADPTVTPEKASDFVASTTTPYLSRLLQMKKFEGNLVEQVHDAKTRINLDDLFFPGEDAEDEDEMGPWPSDKTANPLKQSAGTARVPAVMRVPARTNMSLTTPVSDTLSPSAETSAFTDSDRSASADGDSQADNPQRDELEAPLYDVMDVDLSPNTFASNIAPSLVSDDGEYDDSEDGSSSETSEDLDSGSVSDVAEISLEDSDETPRAIHHRDSTSAAVKLRKSETKHVTFVTPIVSGNVQARRKRKA